MSNSPYNTSMQGGGGRARPTSLAAGAAIMGSSTPTQYGAAGAPSPNRGAFNATASNSPMRGAFNNPNAASSSPAHRAFNAMQQSESGFTPPPQPSSSSLLQPASAVTSGSSPHLSAFNAPSPMRRPINADQYGNDAPVMESQHQKLATPSASPLRRSLNVNVPVASTSHSNTPMNRSPHSTPSQQRSPAGTPQRPRSPRTGSALGVPDPSGSPSVLQPSHRPGKVGVSPKGPTPLIIRTYDVTSMSFDADEVQQELFAAAANNMKSPEQQLLQQQTEAEVEMITRQPSSKSSLQQPQPRQSFNFQSPSSALNAARTSVSNVV